MSEELTNSSSASLSDAVQHPDAGRPTPKRTRHIVGHAEELPPGSRKLVTVNGREIGIFHVNGALYALRNLCPHRGGPLCKGRLRPLVVSEQTGEHSDGRPKNALQDRRRSWPGQLIYEREGEILKCPWHQWEFDLKTGQALYDSNLRVRTYTVVQEGDEIVLYL